MPSEHDALAPVVSVIMPVRNGAETITAQLDALAAQVIDVPWEVVVADNGSDDATRRTVLSRRETFPVPLRLVDASQRAGAAYARNAGILAARGDLIAFCDADDVVAPGWLAALRAGLEEHDVVGGPLRRLTSPFDAESPLLAYTSISDDSIMTCSAGIRRDVLLRAGGFDATFSGYGREDHELSVRLWKIGARFGYRPDMLAYYRLNDAQLAFVRKIYSSGRADVMVWRRHEDLFPGRTGRVSVLREALALPVNLVSAARGGGARRMARTVVDLAAHARTLVPPQRALPPPVLLADLEPAPEIR